MVRSCGHRVKDPPAFSLLYSSLRGLSSTLRRSSRRFSWLGCSCLLHSGSCDPMQRDVEKCLHSLPRHGFGSCGVMKDDADCMALAGADPAHPMAQVDAIHAARALHRSMMDREDHPVSLAERYDLSARLLAWTLLREHEFATREVLLRDRQEEGDLQREDMLAIEILMQAVVIALAVVQEERCRRRSICTRRARSRGAPSRSGCGTARPPHRSPPARRTPAARAPRGRRRSHGRRDRWRGAANRALRSARPLWAMGAGHNAASRSSNTRLRSTPQR